MSIRQTLSLLFTKPGQRTTGTGQAVRDAINKHKQSVRNLEDAITELINHNKELELQLIEAKGKKKRSLRK